MGNVRHADPGQFLTARMREARLREVGLWRILEVGAIGRRPERAVVAAPSVYQLVQAGPFRRLHALLAVRAGQGADSPGRGIELDGPAAGLRFSGLPVGGRRPRFALALDQDEIAQWRHVAEDDERVPILEVHRRQLPAVEAETFPGAGGHAGGVGALPGAGVEYDAPMTGARRARKAQQPLTESIAGRRGGPIDEAALVFPLRHGLTRGRRTDAFRRAPGMLAKEQEIAPHRGALLCPLQAVLLRLVVLRFEAVVPPRQDLPRARAQLRRPKRPKPSGGGPTPVFPIRTPIPSTHGEYPALT